MVKYIMAFNDATCPKCRRKVSWIGKLTDRPACRCGHSFPKSQLEEEEKELDALENKLMNKILEEDE